MRKMIMDHGRQGRFARSDPKAFRSRYWRVGNALVSALARLGVGPIELLTTTGRFTGRPHTVPVVPIEHAGARWLVAPYGPVGWVHNVRAGSTVRLRHGRRRTDHAADEATAAEAGPVLKRYAGIASRTRRSFTAGPGDPAESFAAEAPAHPVFRLRPAPTGRPGSVSE